MDDPVEWLIDASYIDVPAEQRCTWRWTPTV